MKILHLFKTYFPDSYGGIEQFIYQLARKTAARGHAVHVLSLSPDLNDETHELDNHVVHRVRRHFEVASTGMSLSVFRKFATLAQDADLVHYHHPWPFADVIHFLTRHSKPSVLTYHSDIVRQTALLPVYRPLMRRFYRNVDRIVATSENYLNSSDTLEEFRDKTDVIPIGLDAETYPAPDPIYLEKWRRKIGEPFFFFIGVLRYYKGLHVLIDAIRGTNYRVVIAGAGPMEKKLRAIAADLESQVFFLGALSDQDKVALFSLCYAAVFPSHLRSEAFGISLLEGAMFGKPLISCELGSGTSYVNVDGLTGLVVRAGDTAALRGALRMLDENPAAARGMGVRARARFEAYFSADQMCDRYIELYEDVVASRQRSRPY